MSQDSLSWSVWYQSDFEWNHSLPSLSPKRSLHWPWRNLPCPLIGKLYVIAISNQCTFKLVTNDYRWVIYRQAVVEREKHGDQSAFNLTSLSSRNSTLTEQVFNQAVDKCPKVQSVSITSPGISDTQLYRQLTNQGFIQIIFSLALSNIFYLFDGKRDNLKPDMDSFHSGRLSLSQNLNLSEIRAHIKLYFDWASI